MNSQENFYDVIVVGAGPGGSAAAEKCAKYELKTLLLEKEKLPRDKPCGGMCSIIENPKICGPAITKIIENKSDCVKFYFNGKPIYNFKYNSLLFSRKKLDYFITKRAIKSGAKVIDKCEVIDIIVNSKEVRVVSEKGIFISKTIIGADGVNSIVAKKTGLNKGWNKNDVSLAIKSEIKMNNKEIEKRFGKNILVYIHSDFSGYGWIFPKDGCVNIGIGCRLSKADKLRDKFDNFAQQFGFEAKDVQAHMIPTELLKKSYKERALLCGDAGGFVYSILGAGIELAIRSGKVAATVCNEAVKNNDFSLKMFKKYNSICKPLIADIKTSSRQLKLFEFAIKCGLVNSFTINAFLKYLTKPEN
ncbi:MAG: geranylgeranyl reductase family protein [Candidatus Aenigmarchaeota archaeon]|nr:geranylgeranyl reductase family protein [Candidatus Aenigmarchaeota archaeon]